MIIYALVDFHKIQPLLGRPVGVVMANVVVVVVVAIAGVVISSYLIIDYGI